MARGSRRAWYRHRLSVAGATRVATLLFSVLLLLGARPAFAQGTDAPAVTDPAPQISLVTFGPGHDYWQRFGHDAILVGDPADPNAPLYNYGMFDFNQENFFLNFARGHMVYRLAVQPFYTALGEYAYERRWVYLQQLALDDAQRRQLADYLAWNARPENAEYRYDYFVSNCATRVRDALDTASGGAIARASQNVPTDRSYRFEATRLIGPISLLAILMDLGMGRRADVPIDRWQQSFVPMVLKDVVQKAQIKSADGSTRPLVRRGTWLLRSNAWPEPERPLNGWPLLASAGIGFGLLLVLLDRLRKKRVARWTFAFLAIATSIKTAIFGLILIAGWTLTEHWIMWANHNLLLLNPLILFLIPCWWRAARADWQPRPWHRHLAVLIAAAGALTIPLLTLPGAQHNGPWIIAFLPSLMALAWATWRKRAQRPT